MRQLPWEDIVYYGDTARVPYGTKSKESIIRFSVENAEVLLRHKVKMIVVACNSCSSYALKTLKRKFRVPIVGVIRPGAKKAAALTRNHRIGVIATSATIASGEYPRAVRGYNRHMKVFAKACPLFVPLAEEGWLSRPVALHVAREYLDAFPHARIDTLILGCTHYPLLKNVIQKAVGKKVVLVDSAREVAQEAKRLLLESGQGREARRTARYKFLVSDRPQGFRTIAKRFLGRSVKVVTYKSKF
jgi:glutamate racemase